MRQLLGNHIIEKALRLNGLPENQKRELQNRGGLHLARATKSLRARLANEAAQKWKSHAPNVRRLAVQLAVQLAVRTLINASATAKTHTDEVHVMLLEPKLRA